MELSAKKQLKGRRSFRKRIGYIDFGAAAHPMRYMARVTKFTEIVPLVEAKASPRSTVYHPDESIEERLWKR